MGKKKKKLLLKKSDYKEMKKVKTPQISLVAQW